MSTQDPVPFLTSLGQVMATMNLYNEGHPARERALHQSHDALLLLLESDPECRFSFLTGEVVFGNRVLRELKDWEWSGRLAGIGIELQEVGEVRGRLARAEVKHRPEHRSIARRDRPGRIRDEAGRLLRGAGLPPEERPPHAREQDLADRVALIGVHHRTESTSSLYVGVTFRYIDGPSGPAQR